MLAARIPTGLVAWLVAAARRRLTKSGPRHFGITTAKNKKTVTNKATKMGTTAEKVKENDEESRNFGMLKTGAVKNAISDPTSASGKSAGNASQAVGW